MNIDFRSNDARGDGNYFVIPCYNEAKRWNPLYWDQLLELITGVLVFVDDGSTDGTRELLQEFGKRDRTQVITLTKNSGKAEAVRQGFLAVLATRPRGYFRIGFMDADGAFDPEDVRRMDELAGEKFIEGYDALWSSRVALHGRKVSRSTKRHYIGRIIATVLSSGEPNLPYDSQSGFKVFRGCDQLEMILERSFATRWLFDVELLGRWRSATGVEMRIWEEPVMSWNDVPGSKVRGNELARIAREIMIVRHRARRSRILKQGDH